MGAMLGKSRHSAHSFLCLVCVLSTLAGLTACGDQSSASSEPFHGCAVVVRDVSARVLPETSRLSCAAIKKMTQAVPSEAGGYLLEGPSGVLWKCRLYRPSSPKLLLRCTYGRRRFSMVRGEPA
jgi:hypothetical protein